MLWVGLFCERQDTTKEPMETAGVPKSGQSGTGSPSATKVYMLTVCVFLEWGCGAGLCQVDYHFLKVMILSTS